MALLANRLFYLKLGHQSKFLCSKKESLKVVLVLVCLALAYMGCTFFEYSLAYGPQGVVRVVLTPLGKSELYR